MSGIVLDLLLSLRCRRVRCRALEWQAVTTQDIVNWGRGAGENTHITWRSRRFKEDFNFLASGHALANKAILIIEIDPSETVVARDIKPLSWPGHLQYHVWVRGIAHVGHMLHVEPNENGEVVAGR